MWGYECHLCGKVHQMKSKIGQEHYSDHIKYWEIMGKLADEKRAKEVVPTKEETEAKLFKAIFGEEGQKLKDEDDLEEWQK